MTKLLRHTIVAMFVTACTPNLSQTIDKIPDSLGEISGDWDVVSFDKFQPIRLDYKGERNAYFNVDETHISFRMTCNHGGIFASLNQEGRLIKNPHNPSGKTAIGCQNIKRENEFFALIYSDPLIEILPNNRLRLSTEKHEVILERSAVRRRTNSPKNFEEIIGDWNVAFVSERGRWHAGSIHAAKKVYISHQLIKYGDCFPKIKSPKIRADIEYMLIGTPMKASAQAGEETCQNISEAELVILNLLEIGTELEWTMLGNLRLANNDSIILLTKDDNW